MAKTPKAIVLEDKCKACGLCISVCPQRAIAFSEKEFNAIGFHPVKIDKEKCIGCKQCALMCPDIAIEIVEE